MTAQRARLSDVLLGNNPGGDSRFAALAGRTYDVWSAGYGPAEWSVACNIDRIGEGTVGWIHRTDGSYGHIAGLIIFNGQRSVEKERGGDVTYCAGLLWGLPREWWIDGARVVLDDRCSRRAPFGRIRRFTNGQALKAADRAVLLDLLHPVAKEWLDTHLR